MFNILFFGPPGVGKGTQAKLIQDAFKLEHLSTGDMLRAAKSSGSDLGKKVAAIMDAGQLVSDEIVNELVAERITQGTKRQGFIFDGYPRTVAQAETLDALLQKVENPLAAVVFLKASDDILMERLVKRAQDQGRADDTPEVIKARLVAYNEQSLPVAEYYKPQGKVYELDGVGTIEEVFGRVKDVLESAQSTPTH